jgi:hypothetical protein
MPLELSEVEQILMRITGSSGFDTEVPMADLALDSVEIIELIYELDDRYSTDLVSESTLLKQIGVTPLSGLVEFVNAHLAERG